MPVLDFPTARQLVIDTLVASAPAPGTDQVTLFNAAGRVLAETVLADRDYPPTDRSIRDGFAVQSTSLPGSFQVTGDIQAGHLFLGEVGPGGAVEIMTGAPLPPGADQVLMVEHCQLDGGRMETTRPPAPGEFINRRGAEVGSGEPVANAGIRLNYATLAMLATVGKTTPSVFRKPRVAILATGDELVNESEQPAAYQIRNSNSISLAAQVERAGGIPSILPVAKDSREHTRQLILEGLNYDVLLLSGGVSAGKYDFVEPALADIGAEFFFDGVLIQPGKPLVFGRARDKFFFGLPGNPGSTMVTFELFARPAIEILGGQKEIRLPLLEAALTVPFRHKPGLTRFLPAELTSGASKITPVPWQGSSDVRALSRANCFLVADSNRESWQAGERIQVLLQ